MKQVRVKRTFSTLFSLVFMLSMFLTACGKSELTNASKDSSSSSTSSTSSSSTPSSNETIKFGFISSLSGGVASSGALMKQGAELAIKHINDQGGIAGKKVELIIRDDKGKSEEAVKVARDLHNEGVNLFLGVISSGVALALSPAMEELDSVVITAAAHSDRLTGKDFNKHYFRITDNAQMRNYAGAKIVAERYPKVTKWATFSPDYEYGHNTSDRFFEALKKYNPKMELIHESWPPFGSPDFKNYITAVQNSKPQGVFSSLYAGDAIVMSKQAEPYQFYQGLEVFINPSAEIDIRNALGDIMHEEWGGLHYYAPAHNNPINKKFVEDYQAAYGSEPDGFAAEAYNALLAYKAAIEKAQKTDTSSVIAALEGIEFDSLTGKRFIRAEDHQAIKDVIWIHIVPTDEAPGWKVAEHVIVPGSEVITPPEVN
jgi:branched-chain amino acid transport system substrate-binding protein